MQHRTVLMREPGASYPEATVRERASSPIDLACARAQHLELRGLLERLGLETVVLPAADELPDSVFVEDPALVRGDRAILLRTATPARRGEAEALAPVLERYKRVERLEAPACADGGDLLDAGKVLFAGLSERTNRAACEQLQELLPELRVLPVEVRGTGLLHLKSGATYLGRDTLLVAPGRFDSEAFRGYTLLETAPAEDAAANAVVAGGAVILPAGHPRTEVRLRERGFRVETADISEFAKGDGGLSCLCLFL